MEKLERLMRLLKLEVVALNNYRATGNTRQDIQNIEDHKEQIEWLKKSIKKQRNYLEM